MEHILKKEPKASDQYRIRMLKLKYTKEKFLEVGATVEKRCKSVVEPSRR